MMMRRFTLLAIGVMAMAAATPSWGQVVIGNFEGGSLDGWKESFDVESGAGSVLFSDNFYGAQTATNGTYALNVADSLSGPGKFRWNIVLDNNAFPNLGATILANPILKLDVSWVTAEWTPDTTPADPNDDWAKWEKLSVNDNTGWQEVNVTSDTGNPSFPGAWDANNFGASHTRTLTYDLRTDAGGNPMAIDAAGFTQLTLATNYSGKFVKNGVGGSFWVDNIRLTPVPEPGTLGMIAGLGLLPVIRRRVRR